jgi:Domain of unknown function (DUF4388)
MTKLGGSLRLVRLPILVQLLADIEATGQLRIARDGWTGEVDFRGGQIVGARLGAEHGRPALESIALGLMDADFSFVETSISSDVESLVALEHRAAYMAGLSAEAQRLLQLIPSLSVTPRLSDAPFGDATDAQVTVPTAALQLIPAIALGQRLEQIARQRGVARTLRDLVALVNGGLVSLEPAPTPPVAVPPRPAARPFSAQPTASTQTSGSPRAFRQPPPRQFFGVRAAVRGFFVTTA